MLGLTQEQLSLAGPQQTGEKGSKDRGLHPHKGATRSLLQLRGHLLKVFPKARQGELRKGDHGAPPMQGIPEPH